MLARTIIKTYGVRPKTLFPELRRHRKASDLDSLILLFVMNRCGDHRPLVPHKHVPEDMYGLQEYTIRYLLKAISEDHVEHEDDFYFVRELAALYRMPEAFDLLRRKYPHPHHFYDPYGRYSHAHLFLVGDRPIRFHDFLTVANAPEAYTLSIVKNSGEDTADASMFLTLLRSYYDGIPYVLESTRPRGSENTTMVADIVIEARVFPTAEIDDAILCLASIKVLERQLPQIQNSVIQEMLCRLVTVDPYSDAFRLVARIYRERGLCGGIVVKARTQLCYHDRVAIRSFPESYIETLQRFSIYDNNDGSGISMISEELETCAESLDACNVCEDMIRVVLECLAVDGLHRLRAYVSHRIKKSNETN